MAQRTSPMGREFLERHEGVVLRAYRDAVGVWTIGAGLTSASGVVDVKPGMVIDRAEAARLLDRALERNYEPAVRVAMGAALCQHEFDGAVSFHFNTGAIGRASWVPAFLAGNEAEVRARLALWRKGGGKVLPGLVRRRAEEADLILLARYGGAPARPAAEGATEARIALDLGAAEMGAVRDALRQLGYAPGPGIARTAVEAFQRDHGLTVDGILGRATLTTLQRRLDARAKGGAAAAAGGSGAVATTVPDPSGFAEAGGWLVLAAAALWLAVLAWRYRDALAARITPLSPRLAAFLRSF